MGRILVVDDEQSMREMLAIMLGKEGYEVVTADSRASAAKVLGRQAVDLVITDVRLGDGDGIEILRHVRSGAPETIVIVMTAYGSTETAVAALKLGAFDYLTKPFDVDELKIVVRNALERQQLREENVLLKAEFRERYGLERIVGSSPAMIAVFEMMRSVAGTGSTVLITGESGTGKELVAKALHALSPRRDAPFVSINCGALPEALLESELFGHLKGAFTDAHQSKKGLFEAAHTGTLFLDEVGETPTSMQVKLLRAIQERRIRRVGGTEEIAVDVRLVAATNRPLDELTEARGFRRDLFYRLNVIPIAIPPLRDRREDIPLLAELFLRRFNRQMEKQLSFSPPTLELLVAYPWPGNVRELENVVERAVALEAGSEIGPDRLPDDMCRTAPASESPKHEPGDGFRLDAHLRAEERRLLDWALDQSAGSRSRAAQLLGVTPRSLRYLIRKHQVVAGGAGQ
jgi:two-component system response regulator PilR (NtrC family)